MDTVMLSKIHNRPKKGHRHHAALMIGLCQSSRLTSYASAASTPLINIFKQCCFDFCRCRCQPPHLFHMCQLVPVAGSISPCSHILHSPKSRLTFFMLNVIGLNQNGARMREPATSQVPQVKAL